jgi:TPR repeat protein
MAPVETLPRLMALLTIACCATAMRAEAAQPRTVPSTATASTLDPVRLAIRQKDFAGAQRQLEQLARGGNADAKYLLGALLLTNPQGDPDVPGARAWLQQSAAAGEPRAAYMLSVLASTATPPDADVAARWLESAASGGIEAAVELRRQGRLPMTFLPAIDLTESAARQAAFARAASANDVATLQRLGMGAESVNAADDFGRGALSRAALNDADAAVAWLLAARADVKARDHWGATALMLAAGATSSAAVDATVRDGP